MTSKDVATVLRETRIVIAPETFHIVSLSDDTWRGLQQKPELSPRMKAPFAIFKDAWEITLILDNDDFLPMHGELHDAKIEQNFRLMSFDASLAFDQIGYLAAIAEIFAEAEISILTFSSFSRDHFLVRQDDLARALRALRGHVAEVC